MKQKAASVSCAVIAFIIVLLSIFSNAAESENSEVIKKNAGLILRPFELEETIQETESQTTAAQTKPKTETVVETTKFFDITKPVTTTEEIKTIITTSETSSYFEETIFYNEVTNVIIFEDESTEPYLEPESINETLFFEQETTSEESNAESEIIIESQSEETEKRETKAPTIVTQQLQNNVINKSTVASIPPETAKPSVKNTVSTTAEVTIAESVAEIIPADNENLTDKTSVESTVSNKPIENMSDEEINGNNTVTKNEFLEFISTDTDSPRITFKSVTMVLITAAAITIILFVMRYGK